MDTFGETVVHALDHDVQDVDVEFARGVTSDVTCYDSVTQDVTCLRDVFHNVVVHLMILDVSLHEALGLDVI